MRRLTRHYRRITRIIQCEDRNISSTAHNMYTRGGGLASVSRGGRYCCSCLAVNLLKYSNADSVATSLSRRGFPGSQASVDACRGVFLLRLIIGRQPGRDDSGVNVIRARGSPKPGGGSQPDRQTDGPVGRCWKRRTSLSTSLEQVISYLRWRCGPNAGGYFCNPAAGPVLVR